MRNQKRETSDTRAYEILDEAPFMSIACIDLEGKPYLVSVSGARKADSIYFHCAQEGKKWDCLSQHPEVCVTAVSRSTTLAKQQSVAYASCIVYGNAEILQDIEEKHQALKLICERFTPDHMQCVNGINQEGLQHVGIIKIKIHEITGKENPIVNET